MAIIQATSISKTYTTGPSSYSALKDISFEVEEGEFVALVGPSGSGKTTLLNLLGCLMKPDSGCIQLEDEDISPLSQSALSRKRLNCLGFIFQDYNLLPALNVSENVEYILWLQGVPSAVRIRRARETLTRVGLESMLKRRPAELSRGQQQRVAVARAIVHRPRVVLGDELTANLDSRTGAELMDFLRELNAESGITFLYATHDPVMIERAGRVLRLHDGVVQSDEKRQ